MQTVWQGTHFKRATNGPTQPNVKPVLKKSDTAPATSNLRNRLNTGVQSSVRSSSKSDCIAVPISASRFRRGSNAAWSCPMNTAGSRISLGCLVKTRTGLVPAVTQFLHTPSQSLARDSARATNTAASRAAAADKSRHQTTAVSKRPAAAQKSLPPTALSKAARNKGVSSTAAAGDRKAKVQAKPNSRPSLLPLKSRITNGLTSTSSTSSCTATLDKAKGTARGTASYQSDRQPTDSSTRRMFEREGNKNTQQVDSSSRLSQQVAASSSGGFRRSAPAAAAAAASTVKEKSSIHTHGKKGQSFVNGKPPQIGLRRTASSVTVPRPPRITSHTRPATVTTATKTPATKIPAKAVPQTEGAKVTAAQEERM